MSNIGGRDRVAILVEVDVSRCVILLLEKFVSFRLKLFQCDETHPICERELNVHLESERY